MRYKGGNQMTNNRVECFKKMQLDDFGCLLEAAFSKENGSQVGYKEK